MWKVRGDYCFVLGYVSTEGYGRINELDVEVLNVFLGNCEGYSGYL